MNGPGQGAAQAQARAPSEAGDPGRERSGRTLTCQPGRAAPAPAARRRDLLATFRKRAQALGLSAVAAMAAAGDLNAWGERGDGSMAIAPATAAQVSLPLAAARPGVFPLPVAGYGSGMGAGGRADSLHHAGGPLPEGGPTGSLRVLTWNVLAPAFWEEWVEALGWWETPGVRRARELLAASQRLGADLVAFQEVTSPFLRLLSTDPHWRTYHATFQATPSAGAEPPGGLLILSRHPITRAHYLKLPSPTGRALLSARIAIDGQDLTLATLHLESLPEEATARTRQIQAIAGNRGLDSQHRTLIVGDFNHGDGDKEQRLPHLAGWRDAWLTLRPDPDDAGLTYDIERNPLARANAFATEPSRRLDRILLSSDLTPLAVGLVTPGPGQGARRPPSDHYGVWIDITWPPSAAP